MSITIKNLESALAGESQAHIKYRYFAKLARAEGFEEIAKHFGITRERVRTLLCRSLYRMSSDRIVQKMATEFLEIGDPDKARQWVSFAWVNKQ